MSINIRDPASLPGSRIAVIGAGALGTALGRALRGARLEVAAVVSRRVEAARTLAEEIGAAVASEQVGDLPEDVGFVFCCVPDDALPGLAAELAELPRAWDRVVVTHTSGALTADVLEAVGARGAKLLSFHPMQTFPPDSGADAFRGIYVGLEGEAEAITIGERIAEALGAHPVQIPSEAKVRYHLAGSIASNFLVVLAAMAQEVLGTAGISEADARGLLSPLIGGTLRNLASKPPEEALTGPLVRGDLDTVSAHLEALTRHAPRLLPAYRTLAAEAVRLAVRSERLGGERADALLRMLRVDAP